MMVESDDIENWRPTDSVNASMQTPLRFKRTFGTDLTSNVQNNRGSDTKSDKKAVLGKVYTRRAQLDGTPHTTRPQARSVKTSTCTEISDLEYTVHFEAGPLGIKLEPVVKCGDREVGCRVLRFVDGGENNPGQARLSGKIRQGDLLLAIDGKDVISWNYPDIVALLRTNPGAAGRDIEFRSVWSNVTTTGSPGRVTQAHSVTAPLECSKDILTTPPQSKVEKIAIEDGGANNESPISLRALQSPSESILYSHVLDEHSATKDRDQTRQRLSTVGSGITGPIEEKGCSELPKASELTSLHEPPFSPSRVRQLSQSGNIAHGSASSSSKPLSSVLRTVYKNIAPAAGVVAHSSYSLTSSLTSVMAIKLGEALVGHSSNEFDSAVQLKMQLLAELSQAKATLDRNDEEQRDLQRTIDTLEKEKASYARAKESVENDMNALKKEQKAAEVKLRDEQEESDRLRDQIKSLHSQIELLREQADSSKLAILGRERELASKENDLQTQLKIARDKSEEVKSQSERLQSAKARLDALERESNQREEALQAQLCQVNEACDKMAVELKDQETTLATLEESHALTLEKMQSRLREADESIARLRTDLEEKDDFVRSKSDMIQILRAENDKLHKELGECKSAAEAAMNEKKRAEQELQKTKSESAVADDHQSSLECLWKTTETELKTQISLLESGLEEKIKQIRTLQDRSEECDSLKETNSRLATRVESVEFELENREAELAATRMYLDAKAVAVDDMQSNLACKDEELASKVSEVEKLSEALARSQGRVSELESALDHGRLQVKTVDRRHTSECQALSAKLRCTGEELTAAMHTIKELETSKDQLKQMLTRMTSGSNSLWTELAFAKTEADTYKNEVANLQEMLRSPLTHESNSTSDHSKPPSIDVERTTESDAAGPVLFSNLKGMLAAETERALSLELQLDNAISECNLLRTELSDQRKEQLEDTEQILAAFNSRTKELHEMIAAKEKELIDSELTRESIVTEAREELTQAKLQIKVLQQTVEESQTEHRTNVAAVSASISVKLREQEEVSCRYKQEVQKLSQHVEQLSSDLALERNGRTRLIAENEKLEASCHASNEEAKILKDTVLTLRDKLNLAEETSTELRTKCVFFEEELLESERSADDAKRESLNRLRRMQGMEDDMVAMAKEIELLVRQNELMEDQLIEMKASKGSAELEVEKQMARASAHEKAALTLSDRLEDQVNKSSFLSKQLLSLQNDLKSSLAQNSYLEVEIESLAGELSSTKAALSNAEFLVAEKDQSFHRVSEEMNEIRSQLELSLAKENDLKTEIISQREELEAAKATVATTEALLADKDQSLHRASKEMSDIRSELEAVSADRRDVKAALATTEALLAHKDDSIHQALQELNDVRSDLEKALANGIDLNSQVDTLASELGATKAVLEKTETLVGERDQSLDVASKMLEDARSQLRTEQDKAQALENKLTAANLLYENNTRDLRSEVDRLRKLVTDAEQNRDLCETMARNNRDQLEKQRRHCEKLKVARADAVEKLEKANQLLATQKASIDQYVARACVDQKRYGELQLKLKTLDAERSTAIAKLSNLEEKYHVLQKETEKATADARSFQEREKSFRSTAEALRDRVDELQSASSESEIKLQEMEDLLSSSKKSSKQFETQLEDKVAIVSHLEAKVKVLESTISRMTSDSVMTQEALRQSENKAVRAALLKHEKEASRLKLDLEQRTERLNHLETKIAAHSRTAAESRSIEEDLVAFISRIMKALYTFVSNGHLTTSQLEPLDLAELSADQTGFHHPGRAVGDTDFEELQQEFERLKQLMVARDLSNPHAKVTSQNSELISSGCSQARQLLAVGQNNVAGLSKDNEKLRKVLLSVDQKLDHLMLDLKSARDALASKEEYVSELETLLSQSQAEREFLEKKTTNLHSYIRQTEQQRAKIKVTECSAQNQSSTLVDCAKESAARMMCSVLRRQEDQLVASSLRKWSCTANTSKAVGQHRQVAEEMTRQLEITRQKLALLKGLLKQSKKPVATAW